MITASDCACGPKGRGGEGEGGVGEVERRWWVGRGDGWSTVCSEPAARRSASGARDGEGRALEFVIW